MASEMICSEPEIVKNLASRGVFVRKTPVMKLAIVHNHFRPGGVRRIIELAAPHLAATLRPRVSDVIVMSGEAPDAAWAREFETRLTPVAVHCRWHPALRYLAEQRAAPDVIVRQLRRFLANILCGFEAGNGIVWAHNQGLGRNLLLTRELVLACAARGVPLVFHHHDWWFDNRWQRWKEMRRTGFRTLTQAAKTLFVTEPHVRHLAINQADAAVLQHHFPRQSGWLPNLIEPMPPPSATSVDRTRRWLREQLGATAPVWLLPCRLLRRKNIAEALLLTRWLRPEAWLVTTGGVTSPDEQQYSERLADAARQHGWRLQLSALGNREHAKPSLPDLFAASEAILMTSIQEGFGLPYLEAAVARRPLIARSLSNIAPDLARFGFRFPQAYSDLMIPTVLFDWPTERRRQQRLLTKWRNSLPASCRRMAGTPVLLAQKDPAQAVPFSRLTLTAQLQVLMRPVDESWMLCSSLNPFLHHWRRLAGVKALRVSPWPVQASEWLSGHAYALRFKKLVRMQPVIPASAKASLAAQEEFVRRTLCANNLYPLVWDPES